MRKTLIAVSLASAAASPAPVWAQAAAPAAAPSEHTFTGNIGLVTDYKFRGISQTYGKPALQGGFDYSHASGLYVGNWNSNVNEGAGYASGNLEMDLYGGWKKTWDDWGLDVGYLYYYYPGTNANRAAGTQITSPRDASKVFTGTVDNKEVYIGGSWKWLSAKYFYSLGDYFSQPGTKGSYYLDVTANYDLGGGWGLVGHVGSFTLKGWSTGTDATKADYTDWKIGVTKDFSGWVVGASYIDTTGKGSCNAANPGYYCFGDSNPVAAGTNLRDAGKGTVVLSVSKTF